MKHKTFISVVIVLLIGCKLPNIYNYRVTESFSDKKLSLIVNSFSANNYTGIANIIINLKNNGNFPINIFFEKTYLTTGKDSMVLSSLFTQNLKMPMDYQFILQAKSDSTIGLSFLSSKGSFNENILFRLNVSNRIDTMLYIKGKRQGYY